MRKQTTSQPAGTKKATNNTAKKEEVNTMKKNNNTVATSDIFAILRGEKEAKEPTKEARKKARTGKEASEHTARETIGAIKFNESIDIDAIEGATDFDKLKALIEAGAFEEATATKKAVRFATRGARFSCWRRVKNIRIYTNNPDLLALDWVADTHEQGLTHSAYTDYKTIAQLLKEN